jgi:hypothetical protein
MLLLIVPPVPLSLVKHVTVTRRVQFFHLHFFSPGIFFYLVLFSKLLSSLMCGSNMTPNHGSWPCYLEAIQQLAANLRRGYTPQCNLASDIQDLGRCQRRCACTRHTRHKMPKEEMLSGTHAVQHKVPLYHYCALDDIQR